MNSNVERLTAILRSEEILPYFFDDEEIAEQVAEKLSRRGVFAHPQGSWIPHGSKTDAWVECSECGTIGSPLWKCCPVCEAKIIQVGCI